MVIALQTTSGRRASSADQALVEVKICNSKNQSHAHRKHVLVRIRIRPLLIILGDLEQRRLQRIMEHRILILCGFCSPFGMQLLQRSGERMLGILRALDFF